MYFVPLASLRVLNDVSGIVYLVVKEFQHDYIRLPDNSRTITGYRIQGSLKVLSDNMGLQRCGSFYREERQDRQEENKRLRALCGLGGSKSQNFNHNHDFKKTVGTA